MAAMRRSYPAVAAVFFLSYPALAVAPPTNERVEGMERVCVYAGSSRLTSATRDVREYRVGLGQNCPITYPPSTSNLSAPPTARLLSDELSGGIHNCVYEQTGTRWTRQTPGDQPCPLFAGMIPPE